MTNKQTREAFVIALMTNAYINMCNTSDMDNAIKALDKQIPQKPLEETKFYGNGKCPSCGAVFMDKSTNYCGNCGQALDWEE